MFVIRNTQMEVFRASALQKFEGEMMEHVASFFPHHYRSMGEEATLSTIRLGYDRAKSYGFRTRRSVCLYLTNMLMLGSHFDCDPQYPWASEILNDKMEQDPKERIDLLTDKSLEIFMQISGERQIYLTRALLVLLDNAGSIFKRLSRGGLKSALINLNRIFPRRYQAIGEPALRQLIIHGTDRAGKYGIRVESDVSIYIVFMFLMGSGFDRDPQFPWVGEVLNDAGVADQGEKIGLLYHRATDKLKSLLSH